MWWSATLATTTRSELYPVAAGGLVLALLPMNYAAGVFSHSFASVLISPPQAPLREERYHRNYRAQGPPPGPN